LGPARSHNFSAFVNHASQRGKITSQVKYQPQTVVFDEPATERAFKSLGNDGSTFTLDGAEPAVRQLKPGSVLFLYGVALRRVTAVASKGADVIVTTTQADLTDAIKDGNIQWQVPVDFTVGASLATPQKTAWLHDLLMRPVWAAESGLNFEGSFLDWDCELGFVPEGANRIKLDIDVKTSSLGGAVVELKGDGYIENLSSIGSILINNGQLDDVEFGTEGFNGKINFMWTAQQQVVPTVVKEVKLKIPGAVWEYPLVIGGLPFILEISAAIIVHPALTSKGSFTTAEFTVTYNGKEGFKSSRAGTATEGDVHGSEQISHETSIFGIGPAGFVGALELPRVELALGIMSPFERINVSSAPNWVGTLNPGSTYLKVATMANIIEELALPIKPFAFANIVTSASTLTSGQTGTMPGPMMMMPCQKAQLIVAGNVGVGAKIGFETHSVLPHGVTNALGSLLPHTTTFEPFEAAMPIFKKEYVAYKNGIKCLGDK
jgi:hypothetical protein